MGGPTTPSLTVTEALEIAKANNNVPAAVTQKLESTNTKVWRKIKADPDEYVMDKDEYAVLNYYQERYKNEPLYKPAVARFWESFHSRS